VVELLIRAMNIRDVVIGAFGQGQNRMQVDHLDVCGGDGRVALAEQLEQPQFLIGVFEHVLHSRRP
jgi:hypothetical protein